MKRTGTITYVAPTNYSFARSRWFWTACRVLEAHGFTILGHCVAGAIAFAYPESWPVNVRLTRVRVARLMTREEGAPPPSALEIAAMEGRA